MSQHEQGKASLVEFLRSIKFPQRADNRTGQACTTHFADFEQRALTRRLRSSEDAQLVRSAN
jgi:hypothetical protein